MNDFGIFLDRDGTINYEYDYLSSPDNLKLIPGSADAIRKMNNLGCKVIITTNQSGIARGILTEQQLDLIHAALKSDLQRSGSHIDAIYYCPHHPEFGDQKYRKECGCRKPKIGMLLQASGDFGIDLSRSFVVGDKMIDIQTGNNCGAASILVQTGYGKEELELCRRRNVRIDFVAADLLDAFNYISTKTSKLITSQI